MPLLEFISDKNLRKETAFVIEKALEAKVESEKKFGKNVIDPFAALFEISGTNVDHKTWKLSETVRQTQKTLLNHVGAFHQSILGNVEGWEDLKVGGEIDLVCIKDKIIAEVKNKHNTVSGKNLAGVYKQLHLLVMPKSNVYKNYTAYFVNIIPKKSIRFNKPFTPSDPSEGEKCKENKLIRIIDGASFYALVTGRENALEELYEALPTVIEDILINNYGKIGYTVPDKDELLLYFNAAFKIKPAKKAIAKKVAIKKSVKKLSRPQNKNNLE